MLRHSRVFALIKRAAVKAGEAMPILWEMGRDPVNYYTDTSRVQPVDHVFEIIGITVTGSWGKIARHLIAP